MASLSPATCLAILLFVASFLCSVSAAPSRPRVWETESGTGETGDTLRTGETETGIWQTGEAAETGEAWETGARREKRSDDADPLKTVVDNLAQKLSSLEAKLSAQQTTIDTLSRSVAFHAISTDDITVPSMGTVVLPHVITNTGRAYDAQTGFFTAPASGLYLFHASFMDQDESGYSHAGLYVGDTLVAISISDSRHGYYDNPSIAAIVHVTQGQKVSLRSANAMVDTFYAGYYTTFSGFLIRAD